MPHVGSINLQGSTSQLIQKISEPLQEWLAQHQWDQMVTIQSQQNEDQSSPFEVQFLPGEYQSNGQKKWTFEKTPDWTVIKQELLSWLYELEP